MRNEVCLAARGSKPYPKKLDITARLSCTSVYASIRKVPPGLDAPVEVTSLKCLPKLGG